MNTQFIVHVVDDDDAVRDALVEVLAAVEMPAKGFASAKEFLGYVSQDTVGCLVLDIRMPGMSGLEMQREVQLMGNNMPVIFITGHADVPMAVEAIKRGAVDFIEKPFREQELLDRIHQTMEQVKKDYDKNIEIRSLNTRLASLSKREAEVLRHIADGQASKVIALELGISQRTVENHRAKLLEKLQVKSTSGLIKLMVLANG